MTSALRGALRGRASLFGELAVALERARQVAAHRLARRLRVAVADRLVDLAVLFLQELDVRARTAHALGQPAHDAPRNEMAADELEEARELRVASRLRDRAVQGEILVDGALVLLGGAVDGVASRADRAHLALRGALGREARGLDLDAQAQLHHVEDVVERLHALRLDAKRRVLGRGR